MRGMNLLPRIPAFLATIITAVSAQFGVAERAPEAQSVPDPPQSTVTLHDADPRWTAAITADIESFERAGLDPVVSDVHVWDAERTDQCNGHAGYFTPTGDGRRVDICIDFNPGELGEELRHKLVLHELAHAWIHVNSPDDQRRHFMSLRGVDNWNDSDHEFHRGTELAANAVAAMLHPEPPSNADQLCGFEILTGNASPVDRSDPCAA
jgi:hypothetical protein